MQIVMELCEVSQAHSTRACVLTSVWLLAPCCYPGHAICLELLSCLARLQCCCVQSAFLLRHACIRDSSLLAGSHWEVQHAA